MRVAVVGLGKMGSALARRLLAQGVEVAVWNRSAAPVDALAAKGATRVDALGEVFEHAPVVLSFLADDAAVRGVLLGDSGLLAAAGRAPDAARVLVEMSTISPQLSATLAAAADATRVGYLRCPVSGNPVVLEAGNLTLIASGPGEVFAAVEPLLNLIGPTVVHIGEAEQARTMKLAVNGLLAATADALAEAVLLCEAAGIERGTALDVIARSAAGSPFVAYKRAAFVERAWEATFTLAMAGKDLALLRAAADDAGVVMPVARLAAELVDEGVAEGLGDLDFAAVFVHLQALAGRPTDVSLGPPGAGR